MSTGAVIVVLALLAWLPLGLAVCILFPKDASETLDDLIERDPATNAGDQRDGGTCHPAA